MTQSQRGHFVTIQPSTRAARPFLDTKSEIRELISHLSTTTSEDTGDSMDVTRRLSGGVSDVMSAIGAVQQQRPLQLSTVIYTNNTTATSDNRLFDILELSQSEIAARIIDGVRRERRTLKITERRSLIDYMIDAIKCKFT